MTSRIMPDLNKKTDADDEIKGTIMKERMMHGSRDRREGQPAYRTMDNVIVRSGIATGGLALGATTMPLLLSTPLTMATTIGMAVVIAGTGTSLKEIVVQLCEAVHRRRNGGHAPGAHLHLATVIKDALTAQMMQTEDLVARTQRVRDAIRAMAAKPLDAYVDVARSRNDGEARRRAMHETVTRCLNEMREVPGDHSIGSMKLEGILHRMTGPLLALLEPAATPPPLAREPATSPPARKPGRAELGSTGRRETPLDKARPAPGNDPHVDRPREPVRRPALTVMLEDMSHVQGGARTAAEITRLAKVVAEAGTRYLTRERRREISTLVNVHLVDMAGKYVRAAEIAQERDLDDLRRRTHEGLLPVLGALREAYSTCLEHVTDEVEAKVRFMEKRHPLPHDGL